VGDLDLKTLAQPHAVRDIDLLVGLTREEGFSSPHEGKRIEKLFGTREERKILSGSQKSGRAFAGGGGGGRNVVPFC